MTATNTKYTESPGALLPCPFCGSSRIGFETEHDADGLGIFHAIKCSNCRARSSQLYVSLGNDCPMHRQEVRDEWNRRTAPVASDSRVPEGWVFVPREPTHAMIERGAKSIRCDMEVGRTPQHRTAQRAARNLFVTMLAIAPSPPSVSEKESP